MTYKKWWIFLTMWMLMSLLVGCNSIIPKVEAPTLIEDEGQEDTIIKVIDTWIEWELLPVWDLNVIEIWWNGTEPFWNFSASWSTLVFNEPSSSWPMATITEAMIMTQNISGTVINIDWTIIDIIVTLWVCSDGMSDLSYTHSTVMTRWSDVWNGCANISP